MEQEKQRPAKIVWTLIGNLLKWNFIHVSGIILEDFPMKVDAHFRKARITLLLASSYSNAERRLERLYGQQISGSKVQFKGNTLAFGKFKTKRGFPRNREKPIQQFNREYPLLALFCVVTK